VLKVEKGALVLVRSSNYWENYSDLGTRLLHILQLCSGTICASKHFQTDKGVVGLSCCCNPLANAMQQNGEEPMVPEALNIINRSEQNLKPVKGKKKQGEERHNKTNIGK
jgi:hypothetical protein